MLVPVLLVALRQPHPPAAAQRGTKIEAELWSLVCAGSGEQSKLGQPNFLNCNAKTGDGDGAGAGLDACTSTGAIPGEVLLQQPSWRSKLSPAVPAMTQLERCA